MDVFFSFSFFGIFVLSFFFCFFFFSAAVELGNRKPVEAATQLDSFFVVVVVVGFSIFRRSFVLL